MGGNTDGGNRTKAYRLRQQQKTSALPPVDALWLADYDEKLIRAKNDRRNRIGQEAAASGASMGASKSKRTVHLDIDEEREAMGVGAPTVAAIAAGAALEAKEEGRRLDNLTTGALEIYREAVATYRDIALTLRDQWKIMAQQVGEALAAGREHFMDLTDTEAENRKLLAEIELLKNGGQTDPNSLLAKVIAQHLSEKTSSPHGNGT